MSNRIQYRKLYKNLDNQDSEINQKEESNWQKRFEKIRKNGVDFNKSNFEKIKESYKEDFELKINGINKLKIKLLLAVFNSEADYYYWLLKIINFYLI